MESDCQTFFKPGVIGQEIHHVSSPRVAEARWDTSSMASSLPVLNPSGTSLWGYLEMTSGLWEKQAIYQLLFVRNASTCQGRAQAFKRFPRKAGFSKCGLLDKVHTAFWGGVWGCRDCLFIETDSDMQRDGCHYTPSFSQMSMISGFADKPREFPGSPEAGSTGAESVNQGHEANEQYMRHVHRSLNGIATIRLFDSSAFYILSRRRIWARRISLSQHGEFLATTNGRRWSSG
ncbi:hypothetical protein BKA70DRAFT_1221562 [Coprinopsis sp. MPI-PUGE-AT-0042]|nr:hypothetical protein BKA70DRAFT_1221562 [Coprinopsis sp. MPI-PUGE-AT-0042]